jgi:hypothetical protein
MDKMERDGWRMTPFRSLAAEVRELRAKVDAALGIQERNFGHGSDTHTKLHSWAKRVRGRGMACADCKHYGKGWRDDIGRCRWDPADGWPLVYASEDYPVVNEWDGEGCPQFKERTDGE